MPFVRENGYFQTELAGVKSGIDLRIRLNKRIPKENLLDFSRYLLANHSQYTAPQLKLTLRIFFANYTSRCYALTNPEIHEITKNLAQIDPASEFYKLWLGIMNQYVFSDMSKLVQKEYEFIHNKQDYSDRLKKLKEINDSISVFLKTQKDAFSKNSTFTSPLPADASNRLTAYRSNQYHFSLNPSGDFQPPKFRFVSPSPQTPSPTNREQAFVFLGRMKRRLPICRLFRNCKNRQILPANFQDFF